MELSGLLGLLIFIADIYAIVKIIQSGATPGVKVVWVLIVILLPLLGLIAWFVAGPGGSRV